jgi:predicted Zn-ribbon and HTH transcriptional regulator
MLGKKKFYRILGNLRDLLSLRKLDAPQEIGASKCNYCGIVFPYEHIDRHPICTQCGSNSFGPYKTEIGPNKDNQLARNLLDKVIAY